MAGSKTQVRYVLGYHCAADKAKWFLPSELTRAQQSDWLWERVDEQHGAYAALAAMAGPVPITFVEEVSQPR